MMGRAFVDDQPQALVVQASSTKNCCQFPNIVNLTLIAIGAAGFGSAGCHENSIGPPLTVRLSLIICRLDAQSEGLSSSKWPITPGDTAAV